MLELTRDGIGERTMNEFQRLHDELDAALAESAPLAWRIAPASCFEDPATGASCAYYHRVWQYLLLLGATSSMRTDTAFLINTLRAELRSRRAARVLICGAADYGLLAHVLWAAMLESATPDITVLDRCDTSLASNRWYARRQSTTVATVNADILKAEIAGTFDVVCTHSFLGWFSPVERRRLVDVWRGDVFAFVSIWVQHRRVNRRAERHRRCLIDNHFAGLDGPEMRHRPKPSLEKRLIHRVVFPVVSLDPIRVKADVHCGGGQSPPSWGRGLKPDGV